MLEGVVQISHIKLSFVSPVWFESFVSFNVRLVGSLSGSSTILHADAPNLFFSQQPLILPQYPR
jgi:hypothetical protein